MTTLSSLLTTGQDGLTSLCLTHAVAALSKQTRLLFCWFLVCRGNALVFVIFVIFLSIKTLSVKYFPVKTNFEFQGLVKNNRALGLHFINCVKLIHEDIIQNSGHYNFEGLQNLTFIFTNKSIVSYRILFTLYTRLLG